VRWFSGPLLLTHLSLPFNDELHKRALVACSDEATGALVLDDADKIRPTEYGAERLFMAIDSRYQAGRGLLLTSNLDLEQLARKYPEPHGEAIASRLVHYCEVFALEGEDRRMEGFAA
jgi:DNA replication protein DnaC